MFPMILATWAAEEEMKGDFLTFLSLSMKNPMEVLRSEILQIFNQKMV